MHRLIQGSQVVSCHAVQRRVSEDIDVRWQRQMEGGEEWSPSVSFFTSSSPCAAHSESPSSTRRSHSSLGWRLLRLLLREGRGRARRCEARRARRLSPSSASSSQTGDAVDRLEWYCQW